MNNEVENETITLEQKTDLKELLDIDKWLELNAKLAQKKNIARAELAKMGVLEKKGKNTYDNYKYFTEAQYKDIANKLLTKAKLELKVSERDYYKYINQNSKTPVGRIATLQFTLTDTETGFYEESIIRGEGLDRGDKAGYKAYTGAIKYYLANTFLVATGDDVEQESPEMSTTKATEKKEILIQKTQIDIIKQCYNEENMAKLLQANNLTKLEDMTMKKASEIIKKLKEIKEKEVK